MNKTLVFDMDGTLANLYGVKNWLEDLRSGSTRPYEVAEPLYPMDFLNGIIEVFKMLGWKIVVTSWSAKDSTEEYDNAIRKVKPEWLNKYEFPYDEIYVVKYGTKKTECTAHLGGFQVLVDDDEKVRKSWDLGDTIDANKNILEQLLNLLEQSL